MIIDKGYDIMGNMCIVKFLRGAKAGDKKKWAEKFVKEHESVRTIVEKTGKFSGRLRTNKTKHVFGDKTKEVLYKENNCAFRFNIDKCYFSPRLSSERKEISEMIKRGEKVLVMFGGAAPYAVVIGKNSKAGKVVSVELSRECNKYAIDNLKRNKLIGKVEIVQGDVRKVIGRGKKVSEKFDRIVMARPNLKDSFLDVAFSVIKKGGIIHYYGFYDEDNLDEMKMMIVNEARKAKKKIKVLRVKKAGDIGVRKFRYRVDLKVLN